MRSFDRLASKARSKRRHIQDALLRNFDFTGRSAGGGRKAKLLQSVSPRMLLETLEPRVLLSADLIPIKGSLDVPGEVDSFTFSLSQEKHVYFDSQTNNGNLNWSLSGPLGGVTSRAFNTSDNSGGILDLVAGSYTLQVDGGGAATGSYQFRLLDLANAEQVTPGTPVSASLDPGTETDLYKLDAQAGDQFYFNQQSLSGGSVDWRLFDPFDRQVFNSGFSDVDTQTLGFTGVYTLLVEGRVSNAATALNYSFNLQKVTNTTAPLTLGTQVNAAISPARPAEQLHFQRGRCVAVLLRLSDERQQPELEPVWAAGHGSQRTLVLLLRCRQYLEPALVARGGRLHAGGRFQRRSHGKLQFPPVGPRRRDADQPRRPYLRVVGDRA